MKHVVIGTAGHVDHGKTALVRALTGVDTDRLTEEKRRGLTIELGFARLDFPDGSCAGVVDVPGHEKFIKTMLAGAGGIDLAMLVVAADEGFMPQTVEHLNILSLLGVRRGVVVLTKCDLADADWLAMARADLAARVKGTFLENAPVVETSAATGQGIEDLREMLHALVRQTREKSARVPFRLPIDRVFSVDGFGTVVTGTLIEGALHVGGEAELLPSGTRSRVRNLQVHGENTAIAVAGQRVAVNLAGIKKTDIARGDTLAEPDSVRVSRLLDVRLSCLRDSERTVENGSRVHFCHGTAARLAKVVLLDRDALAPGESAYAQLRFTEDVAAKCGDRFVIRFYSPLETIGGGIILDDAPARHKRNDAAVLSALAVRENGSGAERVLQALTALDTALPSAAQLAARLGMEETRLAPELDALRAASERSRCRQRALRIIGARAMSVKELTDRLKEKGESPENAEDAAAWLQEMHLLDDAQYAAMCVRHYAAKGYGAGRIRSELYRRGIPRELWDDALQELPEQDDQIDTLLRRRLRSDTPDRDELRRASDYLYRRGFGRDEIRAAIARYQDNYEEY